MRKKVLYLLTVLALLAPSVTANADLTPAETPAPVVQEAEAQSYLLQLDMPEVDISPNTPSAEVPGFYHGSLYRRWTEVEGVLNALQEQGLVEDYTLLPEANAFNITALPAAEGQLQQLGALSEQGMMAQAAQAEVDQFQAQLDAAIQEAREQAVPMEQPEEPAPPEEQREPEAQEPMPRAAKSEAEDKEAGTEENAFLVQLKVPEDPQSAEEQQHRIDAYLDWLAREGEVAEYEWLPQAYAFRVVAEGELERLSGRPEVAEIVEYSEKALQGAQAAFDEAQAETNAASAPLAPLRFTAYTPTTPTIEVELYDNEVGPRSYTDTTTVFTLTNSTGTVKDVETLCPDGDYTCDDEWDGSPGNYSEWIYFDGVNIEPGDILYVAQEGEASYSITLPDLTANADPDTDTVTGQAPANITSTDPITPPALEVSVNGSQWVTTTATGEYVADSVGDFAPGDTGWIRYYDANHNQVYRRFGVPVVNVRGYNGSYNRDDFVSGYVVESNAPVTVVLERDAAEVTRYNTTSGSNGDFNAYLNEDIQGGDVVKVESGSEIIEVDVPNFDDLVSDPDDNTVTGNTDAIVVTTTHDLPQTLAVWPESTYDGDYGKYVTTTAGVFTATNPFYDDGWQTYDQMTLDWDLGAVGHLRYVNADGNRVYTRFNAPSPAPVLYVRGYRDYNRYQTEDSVGGYVSGCQYEDVDLLVKDSAGTVKDQDSRECGNDGDFYWYISGVIEPRDVVSATFAGKTTTVTVPGFEADADADTDTVTGVISDVTVLTDTYGMTQTLALWPESTYDGGYGKYVLPDGDGAFTATNPFYNDANSSWSTTTVDINYGDVGHARYTDEDENRVYFRFQPPPGSPVLYVRGWDDYDRFYASDRVGGYVPGYCDSIHGYGVVTLLDSSGAVKAQDTQVEACDDIRADLNVNIEPGDVVSATFAGKTTQVTVPAFNAELDSDADIVSGNTDVTVVTTTWGLTRTLAVWPQSTYDWNYGKHVLPDGNGDFTAANPFYDDADHSAMSDTLDIRPGDLGHLRYIDADQNRVYDSFRAPNFYVRGDSGDYEGDGYVRAEIDPNTEITVTLWRGTSVLATANGTSDNGGNYTAWLNDIYGNNADVQAGDEVEFAFGGESVTVDVPKLEAAADAAADEVSGTGPADVVTTTWGLPHTLQVYVNGWTKNVTTTNAGAFVVTGTIDPGDEGWLRYVNTDGYYIYDDFRAPVVYVRGRYGNRYQADNYVSGYASASNTLVTLHLKRGGATVATAYDMADSNGYYYAYFNDAYGNAVKIQGGDVVEIVAGGSTITVDVPTFDVTSDPDDDAIYGTTDADVFTSTYGMTRTLAVWPDSYYDWNYGKHVTTTAGAFTATNPFYDDANPAWGSATLDWGYGEEGHLRYVDADGNRIYDDFEAPQATEGYVTLYVRGRSDRYYAENYVYIYNPGCGDVDVALKDSGGAVKAKATVWACNWNNTYLNDIYGNPVDIETGDTVEATFQGQTTVVNVPEFDVTSNADTDTVYGSTNATVVTDTYGLTQTLAVWPTSYYDGNYGKHVTTTAGIFTATNPFYDNGYETWDPATLNWSGGQQGHLRYIDGAGNRVYDDFQATETEVYAKPVVYVRGLWCGCGCDYYHSENYVGGYVPGVGYSSSHNVTAVLKDSTGDVKATDTDNTCHSGRFDIYFSEEIEAGDTVEVTHGDQTTVVEVPTFDVTSDPDDDAIYGTTDAIVVTDTYGLTQTLAIWPTSNYDWDYGKHVLPDDSDAFTATNPFYDEANPAWWSTNLHWVPGQQGHLRYVDANDNWVYARFVAPREEPEITVHKDGNYVWGYVVTDGETPVTVTLKSGDTVKATAYATSDIAGWFGVNFLDSIGLPILIEEGDDVLVETPDMAPVTVPVVHLTGQADVNADTVSGEGPADDLVNVILYDEWWWWLSDQSTTTDGSGVYNADFKGVEDVKPGNPVEVRHRNDDGHTVYIQFYAGPKLHAQLNGYYVWGYSVASNETVTVTLKDSGGTVKGSGTDTSDGDNEFSIYLYNATGQRAIIEAGDVLEAELGGGEVVSMTVSGMTADLDAETDTLSGTGPANDQLGVDVGNFDETVETDGDGNWSADASEDEDITPSEQARVRHINENYHETWLYAVAPVVYVRGTGSDNNDYQADNYVSGWAQGRSVIDITLKRGAATIATRRLDYGGDDGPVYYTTYLNDALGLDVDIQDGDQVIVSASPDEAIDVPDIDAEVDADTDTITGTTSILDADLGVYVNGYNQTVHTDSGGDFVADFEAIDPGDYAYLRYQNDDGHWIHARFQAESTGDAVIYARWDNWNWEICNNCASGQASASSVVATVALKRGGSTLATATDRADNNRWFNVAFTDAAGDDVPIKKGDVIEVTASETFSMMVEEITVETNAESDTLYGTGPAGGNLRIEGDCSGNTTIADDGTWFYNGCDLWNRSNGYVYHTNIDDHRTYLGWAVPYIEVRENGNYVGGTVKRNAPVTVTLQDNSGAERAVETTTSSGSNGWFDVNFWDVAGDPIIIQPNDTVVVQASPTVNVLVTPLSAEIDIANDQVTGSGPAGEVLDVWVYRAGEWYRRPVTVDGSGAFTADFSGEVDVQAGDRIWVSYWNDEGNLVYIDFNASMVRVNAANDIVDGYATPNASVSLTLKRSGSTIATATASTAMGGWFSAFFTDANGGLVDIQAGDTVEVTASPTASVTVEDLSAAVNTADDTITGNGPASSLLLVKAFSEGGGGTSSKSVTSDGDGDFTADFSGEMDLTDASYAYVRYSDANGNQSGFHTTPASSPELEDAEEAVENQGATVGKSTFGAANGDDLTPPITYQGGGKLFFVSEGGSLVLTRPDGSVDDNGDTRIVVEDAPNGLWQVQVRVWGGEGEQYAVAIGKAEVKYDIYLPLVARESGQ